MYDWLSIPPELAGGSQVGSSSCGGPSVLRIDLVVDESDAK